MNTTAATPALQAGHVGLNVTDLGRSTSFYAQVFGLDVLGESAGTSGTPGRHGARIVGGRLFGQCATRAVDLSLPGDRQGGSARDCAAGSSSIRCARTTGGQ